MLIRSVGEKAIAVFLIFTLTFANFALVTKSYAASIFDAVFFDSSGTGRKNVKFDAYFYTENVRTNSVISAMDSENVKLILDIQVQDSGYLKNAQIEIKNKGKPSNLNFEILGNFDELDYIKRFDKNILSLKQINKNSQVNLQLPITYNQEEYITIDKLSNTFDVILTGTYVNDRAEEIEISKNITLSLTWKDERNVKISSEITKCTPYITDGIIGVVLQNSIKVDSKSEKSGAIKSTDLEIEIPKIEGAKLSKVNVIAKSTKGIDGKIYDDVDFSEDNWNMQDDIIKITKNNVPEKVFLSGNEIEEKYYSGSGTQEYLITYIYENVDVIERILNSKIKATVTTFGEEDIENVVAKEFEYELSNENDNIISCEIKNNMDSIYKAYTYFNYQNNDNEIEIRYDFKEILNIPYKDIINEINIKDIKSYYIDDNQEIYEQKDIYYKSISIPKSNFEEIIGDQGSIEILLNDETVIYKFDDKNLIYEFEDFDINEVIIKISNPQREGDLILNISKAQKKESYGKEKYSMFEYLKMDSEIETKYKDIEKNDESQILENNIKLVNTKTKADIELSKNSNLTVEPNELEMKIKLNNHELNSDIYGNSIFEILLPENIEELEITDYKIIYGNGLEISNVESFSNENGILVIRVLIEGIQRKLGLSKTTNGTNIIINSIIKLNDTTLEGKELELKVENSEATNYVDEGISRTKIISETLVSSLVEDTGQESENQERFREYEMLKENIDTKLVNLNEDTIENNVENNENLVDVFLDNYQISGCVWLDENKDGIKDKNESLIENTKVVLIDSDKGIVIDTVKTDSTGKYIFNELTKGNYSVLFEYDSGQYNLAKYRENVDSDKNSDVISIQIEQDGKMFIGAITDVIKITDDNISDINMGLVNANTFDLKLTKEVSKIQVHNNAGIIEKEYNNSSLAKIEIPAKDISSSTVYIEYKIKVENKGDVSGYAKSIVNYIPQGISFDSSLNPDWNVGEDGNLYTTSLANTELKKGQTAELNLILTKKMTEENTGIINNVTEINEDYNIYGLKNVNFSSGNKVSFENDLDSVDVIVSVKTGEVFIYSSVIFTTILLQGITVFIVINKLKIRKRKEGGV